MSVRVYGPNPARLTADARLRASIPTFALLPDEPEDALPVPAGVIARFYLTPEDARALRDWT